MARNNKLPAWATVGTKIIYTVGYSDRARVETINRVSASSAWSVSGADTSPNAKGTRWVSDGSYTGDVLERYGDHGYRFTFAYPLDSEKGKAVLDKSRRVAAQTEIRELMTAWQKAPNADNSMKLRQALARWEILHTEKAPSPARQETERQKLLHPEQD